MAKIFVSRKIPGTALDGLHSSDHEVEVSVFDRPLTKQELEKKVRGVDALLSLLTDKIDGELMDVAGSQIKIVSNYAVGFDNVNLKDATERGIVICNTPSDEVNQSVAEHAWALMLALARRVVEADEATKRGAYKGWEPDIFLGNNLAGKTLGIVGLGRIGSMVAKRAKGFDMNVLYNKRSRDEEKEKKLGVEYAELDDLLRRSDFVTLHVPLTDETRHMVNKDSLYKMKKGVYLVNTARGSIVDEHDLVNALRDGHLSGAALDVFDDEPHIDPELIGMENVILTPHIASATWEAREKMGQQAVSAIFDVFEGRMPSNIVNKEVWDKRRK
jgi:glyoxylate reductase